MNKKMKKALIAVPLSVSLLIPTFSVADAHGHESHSKGHMSAEVTNPAIDLRASLDALLFSMVQEDEKMNLVVQTHNMSQVQGKEVYQVWLIEGDKKYRAGTFIPDEKGNGAVVFPVNFPGEHKWDAVAISHEPTPDSKQPKGAIVMVSNL
jgi:hypothetical protein